MGLQVTTLETAATGHDMVGQLKEFGFTAVDSGITPDDFQGVQDGFNAVLDEYGPDELTAMTRAEVTDKRGGKAGYKRCDEGGENKDSFMYYGHLSEALYSGAELPDVVVDFLDHQAEVYRKATGALRRDVENLSGVYPSLAGAHFPEDDGKVDVSMRTVIYDDPEVEDRFALVGEPHRDISTLTKQTGQNRPGTFFVVHKDRLVVPGIAPGQAALFPGSGIEDRNVFPDVDLEGAAHTAIMGDRDPEERRAVLILLGHASLDIDTSPSFTRTHLTEQDPELHVIRNELQRASMAP